MKIVITLALAIIFSSCCERLNVPPQEIAKVGNCIMYKYQEFSCSYPVYTTVCPDGRTKTHTIHREQRGKTFVEVPDETESAR